MDIHPPTEHVAAETLVDYFLGTLPEWRALELETHLADCDQCVELARNVRSLYEMVRLPNSRRQFERVRHKVLAELDKMNQD
jgi:anti-sigma factor RsiW